MTGRIWIVCGAVLGGLAVALGAFGAHGLEDYLVEHNQAANYETAVRYQMYHALFLLFVGNTQLITLATKKRIFWLVIVGVLFFSGSIYLLSTAGLTSLDTKIIGPVTPLGGLLLIAAWAILFLKILGKKAE